jgi:phage terminase small subunit
MTETADDGSVPLKNARWEAVAQGYSAHGNATRAYVEAGFKAGNAARVSAHHLITKPIVAARIDNLRRSRWKALHMSTDELLAEAAKIARFNIGNILHVTPDGDPYLDLGKASPEDLAAITEVSIEDFTDGREVDDEGNVIKRDVRRVKAKAPNKLQAIAMLAKVAGLMTDKLEVTAGEGFAEAMEAALRRSRQGRKADADEG